MKKETIEKIKKALKEGKDVYTLATSMTSGSHRWRPILEEGQVVSVGCYGSGQGWSDQVEDFYDFQEALDMISKHPKQEILVGDGVYGVF